ncbi:Uncharacterised protein [Mycobacteroides abscessus subsp. massiliense]|nr:Uncharacterised protein [Mycobacteroides abscessus subsp. massiliense]
MLRGTDKPGAEGIHGAVEELSDRGITHGGKVFVSRQGGLMGFGAVRESRCRYRAVQVGADDVNIDFEQPTRLVLGDEVFVDRAFRGKRLGLCRADDHTERRGYQGSEGSAGGTRLLMELPVEVLGAFDIGLSGEDHLGMFGGEGSSGGGRSGLKYHWLPLAGGGYSERSLDLVKFPIVVGDVNLVDITVDSRRAILDDSIWLQGMPQ